MRKVAAQGGTNLTTQLTAYLCGPITGVSLAMATQWRKKVTRAMAGKIECLDPTRDSPDNIRRTDGPDKRGLSIERLLHGKGTVARNRMDIRRSDLVLACFLGSKEV